MEKAPGRVRIPRNASLPDTLNLVIPGSDSLITLFNHDTQKGYWAEFPPNNPLYYIGHEIL
jgi:hypothetical protein